MTTTWLNSLTRLAQSAGLRVTGLILGIIAVTCGALAVIFSGVGLQQARLCKRCKKGAEFQ